MFHCKTCEAIYFEDYKNRHSKHNIEFLGMLKSYEYNERYDIDRIFDNGIYSLKNRTAKQLVELNNALNKALDLRKL